MKHDVTVFTPYPFSVGQKIRIEGSTRNGDWEVIEIGESKMTLRCPVSQKELKLDRFCCFAEEKNNEEWPRH